MRRNGHSAIDNTLFSHLRSVAHAVCKDQDWEDFSQDAILKVLEREDRCRDRKRFKAFASMVVQHAVIDGIRKRARYANLLIRYGRLKSRRMTHARW